MEPQDNGNKRLEWLAVCATVAIIAFVIWIDYKLGLS